MEKPSVNIVLKYLLGYTKRQDRVLAGKIAYIAI